MRCPREGKAVTRSLSRLWLSSEPDRVKVALEYLIDPVEQRVDVVVLCMEVAAGERVVAAGREPPDELRSELRRRPWRVVRERARSHLCLHQAGAEEEDGDPAGEFVCQHLAVAANGGLAGWVRGVLAARKIGRAA